MQYPAAGSIRHLSDGVGNSRPDAPLAIKGLLAEAIEEFRIASQLKPDDAETHHQVRLGEPTFIDRSALTLLP